MLRKFLLFFLVSISFSSFADTGLSFNSPFVSRIKATAQGPNIIITWRDFRGEGLYTYQVYRYTEEITGDNFKNTEFLGEIEAGKQSFVDTPLRLEQFYYLVLAKNNAGEVQKFFILYRNKTSDGTRVERLITEEELATVISDLHAAVQDETSIVITFKSSKPERNLILFRSTSPIKKLSDLINAATVSSFLGVMDRVQDYPVPGVEYYYALVDAELFKLGKVVLSAGESTTTYSVEIPFTGQQYELTEEVAGRSLPLPLFVLGSEIESGTSLSAIFTPPPKKQELSTDTTFAVTRLENFLGITKPEPPEPVILEIDTVEAFTGEEFTLQSILKGPFREREWEEVEDLMKRFLSINHSDLVEARAHFYLGQALYFQGKYKHSFMEFLLAENKYYVDVQPFRDTLYRELRLSGEE